MDTRTVEQVTQWESRPFTGGLAGLHELAEEGFSGAVRAAGTWAFVLNGRVIGIFEGDLEDFEGRDGTAYRAPDQALALLFTMQELGGETQAKYYTNDTPLSEVHETLTSGNFSGYVELSENVLSGDYYVAYYGGRSMSAAFVGESERLLTGDDAFERADDEVGIYEVKKVAIDVIDLSELVEEPEPQPEPQPEPEPTSEPEPAPESPVEPSPEQSEPPSDPQETPSRSKPEPSESEPEVKEPVADVQEEPNQPDPAEATEPASPSTADQRETDDSTGSLSSGTETTTKSSSITSPDEGRSEDVFSEEQEWRQAKAIPSLDPGRSSDGGQRTTKRSRSTKSASKGRSSATKGRSAAGSGRSAGGRSAGTSRSSTPERSTKQKGADDTNVAELKRALQQSKQEIERLSKRLSKAESEQQELRAQREELRAEVDRLTSELKRVKAEGGAGQAASGRSLPAEKALEGTNLFVRYVSKSQPTLEDARDGADREEVNANLSLEHHTQFDTDEVVVDGTEFDTFLQHSIQYRFVKWLVEDLLYEIRDTGHVGQLRELFDAIPKFDRAELFGNATIRKIEDGEEVRTQRTFDVIFRDRMGNPLVVANLNDARDPATGDMMADLVSAANDVGETNTTLSAAVLVTASFFEPAALETATEATGGGLLSREKKESYVKLTRKRGYHLCLVETRGGQFHVNVPEL